jgi:hypothetical protein
MYVKYLLFIRPHIHPLLDLGCTNVSAVLKVSRLHSLLGHLPRVNMLRLRVVSYYALCTTHIRPRYRNVILHLS